MERVINGLAKMLSNMGGCMLSDGAAALGCEHQVMDSDLPTLLPRCLPRNGDRVIGGVAQPSAITLTWRSC